MRWFRPKELRENLWLTLGKLILAALLANALWLENTAVYLIVLFIACYQIFAAFINLVTWWLYKKNQIFPRFSYFFDGLWLAFIGFYWFL